MVTNFVRAQCPSALQPELSSIPPRPPAICQFDGSTMYVSGHLPILQDGKFITGSVGPASGGLTVEQGYEAARWCGLNLLSTVQNELGDLDRIEQVVKLFGIVSSHNDFKEQVGVWVVSIPSIDTRDSKLPFTIT